MRIHTSRMLLLGAVFITVILVIYFSLIHWRSATHGKEEYAYLMVKHDQAISSAPRETPRVRRKNGTMQDEVKKRVEPTSRTALQAAVNLYLERGIILFTMVNDAYFDFAASWCCNTAGMTDVLHRTLFLSTDNSTAQRLRARWPNVTVVSLDSSRLGGVLEYSKVGYIHLMTERTKFILHLLEAGVRMLLFEVDCLWLSDPIPLLLRRQAEADILATRVSGQTVTAGGFLFLNPTQATVQLWRKLAEMMDSLSSTIQKSKNSASVSEALNDQQFFTQLLNQKYAGIRVVHLPSNLFPDGKWYSLSAGDRSAQPRPIIINNNWILGNAAKIQRAKAFGHWFWNQAELKCNTTAVDQLFHS